MPLGLAEEREILAPRGEGFEVRRTSFHADGSMIEQNVATESRSSTFGTTGRRQVGHEIVTAAGCAFECDVFTEVAEAPGGRLDSKWWVSDRYPYVIRLTINGTVMQELVAVQRASR